MIWLTPFAAILSREARRFVSQRGRLVSALLRPLLWLLIFATGFRSALGLSITPPYQTYITYEEYILPGLCGMVVLFNGMQSAFSLVFERETGAMRLLLTAPLPRWFTLLARLTASTLVSLAQVAMFLAAAACFGITVPWDGYLYAVPACFAAGMMIGALGLALSSVVHQLENFAGVVNFVIFPALFFSTALYPSWKMAEVSSVLATLCNLNPFSSGVELVRFAFHAELNLRALIVVVGCTAVFFAIAVRRYQPSGTRAPGPVSRSLA